MDMPLRNKKFYLPFGIQKKREIKKEKGKKQVQYIMFKKSLALSSRWARFCPTHARGPRENGITNDSSSEEGLKLEGFKGDTLATFINSM